MFIEVLVSRVKRAWFYIGRITYSQKNNVNKQAGQNRVTETLWLRFSLIRTLHLKKCGHIFVCALCMLLENIQDTLLSPCPSVVTLTTVVVQDRAVFFYIHPLRQGVFFTYVSSRFWEKSTDQHHENPHVTSTKHMARPGLPTHSRSALPLPIPRQPHLQIP